MKNHYYTGIMILVLLAFSFLFFPDGEEQEEVSTERNKVHVEQRPMRPREKIRVVTIDDLNRKKVREPSERIKSIGSERPRKSEKITSSHLEMMQKASTPLIWRNNNEKSIQTIQEACSLLGVVLPMASRVSVPHSYSDHGELFFIWYGHGDSPEQGYAVRKNDSKMFKWRIGEDVEGQTRKVAEMDDGYFWPPKDTN